MSEHCQKGLIDWTSADCPLGPFLTHEQVRSGLTLDRATMFLLVDMFGGYVLLLHIVWKYIWENMNMVISFVDCFAGSVCITHWLDGAKCPPSMWTYTDLEGNYTGLNKWVDNLLSGKNCQDPPCLSKLTQETERYPGYAHTNCRTGPSKTICLWHIQCLHVWNEWNIKLPHYNSFIFTFPSPSCLIFQWQMGNHYSLLA